MRKPYTLLPLICGIWALQGCETPGPVHPSEMRVEPAISVRHSDSTPDSMYQLGRHHHAENRLDEAADAFRKVIAADAGHMDAQNALAAVYTAQGKFDEAIAELRAIVQKNPGLSYVHNNLGYAYFLNQDYQSAISEFGAAIALEPGNKRAFGNLALVYSRLGDVARAQSASSHAAAIGLPAVDGQRPPPPSLSKSKASESASEPAMQARAPDAEPTPATRAAPLNNIEVEIAHGSPDYRLAATIADALRRNGFNVSRIAEIKPYKQQRTVILYRDGYHKQALALSRSFAVPPAIVNNTRARKASDKSGVRLLLGKSAAQGLQLATHGDTTTAR